MANTRRPGRPKKEGPKVSGAGISLYPNEIALLDRLIPLFRVGSRADVVRRLIEDHPDARKVAA